MIKITTRTADEILGLLAALEQDAGLPAGSLDRIAQGVRILAGSKAGLPEDPYQHPTFFIPGLTARPFWESSRFAFVARLEAAYETIKSELLGLRNIDVFGAEPEGDLVSQGTWAQFDFYINGRKLEENCALCPETTRILESLDEAKGSNLMLFSANAPGTYIKPHCGPYNARLRCHFGLLVPDGCSMRVGAEVRSWEEGRCLVFDDSFEHEVWNRSDSTRVVLLVDVWHPEVTPAEELAFQRLWGVLKSMVLDGEEATDPKVDRFKYVTERSSRDLPQDWWV